MGRRSTLVRKNWEQTPYNSNGSNKREMGAVEARERLSVKGESPFGLYLISASSLSLSGNTDLFCAIGANFIRPAEEGSFPRSLLYGDRVRLAEELKFGDPAIVQKLFEGIIDEDCDLLWTDPATGKSSVRHFASRFRFVLHFASQVLFTSS